MGSSQSRRNNQQLNDFAASDGSNSQAELEHSRSLRNDDQTRMQTTFENALSGYGNMQSGGLSESDLSRLRGLSQGGLNASNAHNSGMMSLYSAMANGSGVDLERLRTSEPIWREMMETGGFDNAVRGRLGNDLTSLRSLAKDGGIDETSLSRLRGKEGFDEMQQTGGVNDENIARIRGAGHFDDFAKTGGFTDKDKMMIRDRVTSSIPATYDALQRSIGTTNRVVGNAGGPASAALTARMGRDASREIASINRDAELALLDRIMEGRKWGASNLSAAEKDLVNMTSGNKKWGTEGMALAENAAQQLRTGNMFRGSEGAFDREFGLTNTIANNKITGATGFNEMERYNQDLLRSERDKAMAGMGSVGSSSAANHRQALNDEWDILGFQNNNRQYGTEGMSSLYNAANNSVHAHSDRMQNARQVDRDNTHTNVQMRHETNPSMMRSIGTALDTGARLAGAAGGVMAGFSSPGAVRRQGAPVGRP